MYLLLAVFLIVVGKKNNYSMDDYLEFSHVLDSTRRLLPVPKSTFMTWLYKQICQRIDLEMSAISILALRHILEVGKFDF